MLSSTPTHPKAFTEEQVRERLTAILDRIDSLSWRFLHDDEYAFLRGLSSLPSSPQETVSVQGVSERLCERIKAELHSESDGNTGLAGALGEAIATAAGSYSLEFVTPEQLAEGICSWLASLAASQETVTYTTEQARMRLRETLLTEEYPQDGTAEEYFIRAAFPDDPQEPADAN